GDQNIPYLVWYAAEPLIESDINRFLSLAKTSELPLVQQSVARRAIAEAKFETSLETLLGFVAEGTHCQEILRGLLAGSEGKRNLKMPSSWPKAFAYLSDRGSSSEKLLAAKLGAVFRDF